jgi:Zn-dependent M28 family amino/carboxypeptidase
MNNKILAGIFFWTSVLICIFPFVQKHEIQVQPPAIERHLEPRPRFVPPIRKPEPPPITPSDAVATITQADLRKTVFYLASDQMQGRLTGTPEINAAADYLEKALRSYGLLTEKHRFKINNNETQNVYGWIEGKKDKNKVIVVGAHYDHLGRGNPGADDNASGTAGVLALAKAFGMLKEQVPYTLVFQFYSAEEYGLHGSKFYTMYPRFPRDNPNLKSHVAMYNLDMIGFLKGRDPAACIFQGMSNGASDHAPFYQAGIPAWFVHTGTSTGTYHTPRDRPETLDYPGMEEIVRHMFGVIWNKMGENFTVKYRLPKMASVEVNHGGSEFLRIVA